jgi:hypothetical protein
MIQKAQKGAYVVGSANENILGTKCVAICTAELGHLKKKIVKRKSIYEPLHPPSPSLPPQKKTPEVLEIARRPNFQFM